jgi:hypothetical protein
MRGDKISSDGRAMAITLWIAAVAMVAAAPAAAQPVSASREFGAAVKIGDS